MAQVYGFDESGIRRIRALMRRDERAPRTGAQRTRRQPVLGGDRLSHFRITAKNCIVDGASLYVGNAGEVFPADYNGGATDLANNYVVARTCTERGEVISDEAEPEEGYTSDTVLVCLPASFRGFVARDTIILAQPFSRPPQIEVGITRCVMAVSGGIIDIVGTGVAVSPPGVATNVLLYKDRPPFFDGTDTEVQTTFVNLFDGDVVQDGATMALIWELVPEPTTIAGTPVQSRLRLTDYGCPPDQEEEEEP